MSDPSAGYLAAGFLVTGLVLTIYIARLWRLQREIARRLADLEKSPPPSAS